MTLRDENSLVTRLELISTSFPDDKALQFINVNPLRTCGIFGNIVFRSFGWAACGPRACRSSILR